MNFASRSRTSSAARMRGDSRSRASSRRRFLAGAEPLEGRQLLAVGIREVAPPSGLWPPGIQDVTTGPDGNIWYTRRRTSPGERDSIGRVTADGTVTEFQIPVDGIPDGITAGPDGNLWFIENIDYILLPIPFASSTTGDPTVVPHSLIGRVTTDGVFSN